MDYFKFKKNILYCENLKVENLAKKYGTPLFIYSHKTIVEHFFKLKKAFKKINPLICYSVKANSNLSILKILVNAGAGLDIVSGGELYRAKKINCPPSRIVYASVGKTGQEIAMAVNSGIFMFNVESENEIKKINKIASRLNKIANVSLRVNPDIEPNTHSYITTGKKETKFGIDPEKAAKIISDFKIYRNLKISGIHLHIGSQITDSLPFVSALRKIKKIINQMPKGHDLEFLNIGGGLGIIYDKETPQTAEKFAAKTLPLLKEIGLKVILEPGRFITGNAGVLVTKVLYDKQSHSRRFIVVDAAMNDFIRPALYQAYHRIVALTCGKGNLGKIKPADIVGPVCESGDFLGKQRKIKINEGQYLAILGAGAYGSVMGSNYNSRCRPPEILVKGNKSYLIRKRENYFDLIRQEVIV